MSEKEAIATLAKKGYKVGKPDGKMGKRTRQAIRDYQRKSGLRVDGKPGLTLLETLMADASTPATAAVKGPASAKVSPKTVAARRLVETKKWPNQIPQGQK